MKSNEQLPIDYDTIRKMAESDTGKRLIQLVQSQGGSKMKHALKHAENGDFEEAKELLRKILQDPEASRLMQQMEDGHE